MKLYPVRRGSAFSREIPGNVPWKKAPLNCYLLEENRSLPVAPLVLPPHVRPEVDGTPLLKWLTPYQKHGLSFAGKRPGTLFFWPGGAGKTAGASVWMRGRTVVVTRASTKWQWKSEIQRLTTLQVTTLSGQTSDPLALEGWDVVVLNWEILPHWREVLCAWAPESVVWDEIHRAKNWKRTEKVLIERPDGELETKYRPLYNISSSAEALAKASTRRLGLSATPIRNRLSDLWSQIDILEPGCWGSNWDFVHRYCAARPGDHGGIDTSGRSHVPELKARLRMVMHSVNREELERSLPPKRRQIAYLEAEDQCVPARGFKGALKRAAKNGPSAIFEVKLEEASSRKRQWVVATVCAALESGQKVVVFSGRKADCDRLGAEVFKKAKGVEVEVAHGDRSTTEREEVRVWYRDHPGPCCLIGTHDAWGEAVDGLQHTDLALFSMLPWTPGQIIQSEARFSRKGQTRPVLIMYAIAAGTADERVSGLVQGKLEDVALTLGDPETAHVASALSGENDEAAIIAAILSEFMEETNAEVD